MSVNKSRLYGRSLATRLDEARRFRVFRKGLRLRPYRMQWRSLRSVPLEEGLEWPDELAGAAENWPQHAFGAANASLLVLWHRPGKGPAGSEPNGDTFIRPAEPVLGGIPHLHLQAWPIRHRDQSWGNLSLYLHLAFWEVGIADPWPHVMVACLNPVPGRPGEIDQVANDLAVRAGGRIDRIVELVRPSILLACGKTAVWPFIQRWEAPKDTHVEFVQHPLRWGPFAGAHQGPQVVARLSALLAALSP